MYVIGVLVFVSLVILFALDFLSVFPAEWLGYHGIILVLLETPSGFALFYYLYRPNALEVTWAGLTLLGSQTEPVFDKEFTAFEDKANATNQETGVSAEFARMIKKRLRPKQKLAVGKQEYKTIIEKCLVSGIYCLFDDAVMELMWGLKNNMEHYVPEETSDLSKEDRLQMSVGMKMVLDRYGFHDVKPEMVNRDITKYTRHLYECDVSVNKHAKSLCRYRDIFEKIPGIGFEGWHLEKLAAAFKLICYPDQEIETGEREELLSDAEVLHLVNYARHIKSYSILDRRSCFEMYEHVPMSREWRPRTLETLQYMSRRQKKHMKLNLCVRRRHK
uniref:Uncharacterized protein n=1 Tax=Leersia perrieri TaxID=77586 RepID=A0A0D9XM43_9ORYZ